jgi:undecaprenyl diphosphate synthase
MVDAGTYLNALRLAYENNPDILPENITEEWLHPYLSMSYAPEPDLFIRTGEKGKKLVIF